MRFIIFSLILCVGSVGFGADKSQVQVAKYLQDISLTIKARGAEGSGVIKTRTVKNNDKEETVSFVWTAGHVVDGLRRTRTVIDTKSGSSKTIIEFDDAQVAQYLIQEGRKVGEVKLDAKVLKFSDSTNGEDLALLQIRKKNFVSKDVSVKFYLEGDLLPPVGSDLLHCGSLLGGDAGSNSITTGIISQNGRLLNGKTYTQTSCAAFPGSSGGGVFLKEDGRLVGFLVRGFQTTFVLHVPMTRVKNWAERNNLMFAVDDSTPVPSQEELDKMSVEDSGVSFSSSDKTAPTDAPPPPPDESSFMIKIVNTLHRK